MCAARTLASLVAPGAAAIAAVLVSLPAGAHSVSLSSRAGWPTWTNPAPPAPGSFLGPAQNVCLDTSGPTPSNCPLAATPPPTDFGYLLGGWFANLSLVAPADPNWIWAPGITGASKPAENQTYSFRSTFLLCGPPMDSEVSLSADNRADLYINGTLVLSNADNATLDQAVVPAALLRRIPNINRIEIKATNDANPPNCGAVQPGNTDGPYSCNPAGVVFNGKFEDALNPWPTCSATMPPGTMTYQVGEEETIGACPAGWTGRIYQTCICSFDFTGTVIGDWSLPINTCAPPPPPPPPRRICLDFDALPAADFGAVVGQVPGDHAFTDQGVVASVETLATPSPSAFGDVHVVPVTVGSASGRSVRFRNASLRFDLSQLPFTPANLSFEFDYRGGAYGFATDASTSPSTHSSKLLDRPVPSPLPAIGASAVSIVQVPSLISSGTGTQQAGTMKLSGGAPLWFEIGGQELYIDRLCIAE